MKAALVVLALIALNPRPGGPRQDSQAVTVGSKKDTESVILGELLKVSLTANGVDVEHRAELGGTRILWEALLRGDIDAYVDYTGTLMFEILAGESIESFDALESELAERGISMSRPLGFNNSYALGMRRSC